MLRLRSRRVPRQVRSSVRFICERIESRVLLAAVNWTGLGDGVNWTNAANWSSNPALPGPADDVTIDAASAPNVRITSGSHSIASLHNDGYLTISGGTLNVTSGATQRGQLYLSGGTLNGGTHTGPGSLPSRVTGVLGSALSFDGIKEMAAVPSTAVNGLTNFTIEFWARMPNTPPVSSYTVLSGTSATVNQDNQLVLDLLPTGEFRLIVRNTSVAAWMVPDAFDGAWRHFAIRRTGTSAELFVNGSALGAQPITSLSVSVPTAGLFIGQEQDGYGINFDPDQRYVGELDDFRIWNVARSATDINDNHQISLNGQEPGLQAYYKFDEGTGIELADSTTNALHGSLTFVRAVYVLSSSTINGITLNGDILAGATHPMTLTAANVISGSIRIGSQLTVSAAGSVSAGTMELTGSQLLTGAGDVTITDTLNWTGGTMSGTGQTMIAAGGTLNLSGSSRTLSRTLQNDGTATWTAGTIQMGGGTFTNNGSFTASSASNLTWQSVSGTNVFTNNGTFTKSGTGSATFNISSGTMPVNNTGTVDVQAGTLTLSAGVTQHVGTTLTGGTWIARNAGTINISTGSNILTNQGVVVLEGTGSSFAKINTLTTNTGTFTLAGGRDFAATPSGGTFTNSGTLNLGAGSVLSVNGAFTQPGSAINVDIAGPVAGTDFGQVTATGAVSLNGTLNANLVGGYDPGFAVSFPVVVGASRTGTFSTFGGSGSTASGRLLRDRYTATSAIVSVRPLAPSAADLIASSDSGVSNTDNITNINTPTFDGTATDVATVRIYADGNLVGSAPVGGGGAWSATASALLDGTRVITATIVDADGDESPVSGSLNVTIDTLAPAQPGAMDLQTASDSGVSGTDNITNINTPVFDLASTDTYHRVERNGGQITGDYATGTTLAEGTLTDGNYSYVLLAVDAAGNVSTDSATLSVTIDTVAPAVPGGPDLQAGSDSGVSATDNITNVTTPTFDVVSTDTYHRVFRDGGLISALYATGGTFAESARPDGAYDYTLRAVDAAGNVSADSTALSVTIDTAAPAVPGAPDLQAGSDSGVSATDNITNINTPTFDVTSTDTYFRFFRGGVQISGSYETGATYTTAAQADGTFNFAIRAVDAAGNASNAGAALGVTIDTVAPAIPGAPDLQAGSDSGVSATDNITNINTPVFDVTSTDLYYRLERGGVQVSGDYSTGAFTSAALVDGIYNFAARSVDAAGNVSAAGAQLSVQIDTVDLAAPTTQFLFETGQSITFAFGEDVAATLVNGDVVVQNLTGGGTVGTLLSYSNPTATFTFTGGILPDGNYRATIAAANVTDLAGNPLGGDAVLDFFVFAGDANRDRTVNISDFSILASRFNLPGTFSQGDFDYSGTVGIGDFSILASKFNTTLPAPADLPRAAARPSIAQSAAGLRSTATQPAAAEPRSLFSDLLLDEAS